MIRPGVVWFGLTLGSLGLVGCGSLGSVPTPLAGDLLGAPTTLNLGGQVFKVTAAPQLLREMDRFSVRVNVGASAPDSTAAAPSSLKTLKVTGIYVVTGSGLWQSPQLNDVSQASNCLARVCARGSGEARGFAAGDDVRVIAQLRDEGGRTYWLRDAQSRNIVPKPLIR